MYHLEHQQHDLYSRELKIDPETGERYMDFKDPAPISDNENAWPLNDVLKKLIEAARILLKKHDYDGHNYEEIQHCIKRGEEILIENKLISDLDNPYEILAECCNSTVDHLFRG